MSKRVETTKKWDKLKKYCEDNGLDNSYIYMLHVEDIVKKFMTEIDIPVTVELLPATIGYLVEYSLVQKKYILNVPISEIKNTVVNPTNLVDIRTNICHEIGHIYYEDPKYFRVFDKTFAWTLRNKIISALAETRADVFANKYTTKIFGDASFNWIPTDPIFLVNPKSGVEKTGYLPGRDRQKLGKEYTEYTKRLVKYLFAVYLPVNRSYEDVTRSVEEDGRLKGKKNWMKKVLFMDV